MTQVLDLFMVGFGGALGAVLRFGVGNWLKTGIGKALPPATLLVNVLGCLAIGWIFSAFRDHASFRTIQLFLMVGVLGGFTTFSAFGLETIELLRSGQTQTGLLNIGLNLGLSLAAVWGGQRLGEWWLL